MRCFLYPPVYAYTITLVSTFLLGSLLPMCFIQDWSFAHFVKIHKYVSVKCECDGEHALIVIDINLVCPRSLCVYRITNEIYPGSMHWFTRHVLSTNHKVSISLLKIGHFDQVSVLLSLVMNKQEEIMHAIKKLNNDLYCCFCIVISCIKKCFFC